MNAYTLTQPNILVTGTGSVCDTVIDELKRHQPVFSHAQNASEALLVIDHSARLGRLVDVVLLCASLPPLELEWLVRRIRTKDILRCVRLVLIGVTPDTDSDYWVERGVDSCVGLDEEHVRLTAHYWSDTAFYL